MLGLMNTQQFVGKEKHIVICRECNTKIKLQTMSKKQTLIKATKEISDNTNKKIKPQKQKQKTEQ